MTEAKRQPPLVRISEAGKTVLEERLARINKARAKAGKRKLTRGDIIECAMLNIKVANGVAY